MCNILCNITWANCPKRGCPLPANKLGQGCGSTARTAKEGVQQTVTSLSALPLRAEARLDWASRWIPCEPFAHSSDCEARAIPRLTRPGSLQWLHHLPAHPS